MIEGYRRRLGLMQQSDPYGRDYLSPVGQGDTPDIIATDPRLYPDPAPTADRNAGVLEQYMPQGLIDFGQSVNAARGKPSLFGKALGAIGLDAEGRRAATSWSDAAKSTLWLPGDMVQGLVDSGQNIHNYLYSGEGPSFHTSPDAADRARAERLTGDVFNVAGALPMASAGMSAAGARMAAAGAHAAGVRVAPREIVAANSKDAALPGLLANTRDTVSSLAQAWGETPQQFMDRAVAGDASRSNMLMGALKGSGIDAAQIPGAVRDTYRGGQYSVAEAKQRIRDLDAEFGKLYVKHNNNEKAVLADPAYGPLNEEMKALTGGALPKEPSRFAQGFEALPSSRKFDLFSNSENAALPGLLRSAQAGEQPQGIMAYHGAKSEYAGDVYNPRKSQYKAFFAAESPELANSFARSYGDAPRVYPVTISDAAKIFDPKGNPAHGQLLAEAIDANPGLVSGSLMGKETIRRLAQEGDGGIMEMPGVQQWLKRKGFDGWKFEDTAANPGIENRTSYGMLKPGHVKSSITGETLFSNPRESSLLSAALAGEQMQQPGITAYHGSPHDFDRFSMDKIGTGEGAQAYGHGLYFAENEAIAKAYRDSLSKHNPASYVDPSLQQIRAKHDALVESITDELNRIGKSPLDENLPPHIKAKLDELTKIVPQYDNRPGRMYEVRINADPEHFLDWDKPLSQQSEKVRDAALGIRNAAARAEYEKRGFPEPLIQEYLGNASKADKTGAQLVQGMKGANQSADFSSQLRAAGIPGIKYLDQGSRTAGEGSRNFVVFDDKLISIVRKYGWAGAAAMLGMSTDDLMSQAQAQQPEKPDPYREALRMKARAKVLGLTP